MDKIDRVLRNVLKKITPTEKERKEMFDMVKKVENAADDIIKPLGLEKTVSGSVIRDTWLTNKKEVDLFILFPTKYAREDLEKIGLEIGKRIMEKIGGSYEIAYAEHPYVRGKYKDFSIDIVPCYKVKSASKIISAVDRTPFHNQYVKNKLTTQLSGEVRLLKQFTKAIGIYGSDLKTQGFSGYLCELLIIYYKSFKKLVKTAAKWEPPVFIDIERHCAIKNPETYFKDQPLIVIDPTDPRRNVASALSKDNFVKFVKSCELFINKPSEDFFLIREVKMKSNEFKKRLKEHGTYPVVIKCKRPSKIVDDIIWPQLRRSAKRIVNLLKEYDFDLFDYDVWADEKYCYIFFEMSRYFLPAIQKIVGPPITSKEHSREFTKKWSKYKIYVEDGRWVAEVERKYRHAVDLINDFLKVDLNKLMKNGIRSHIAESVSKGYMIIQGEDVVDLLKNDKSFAVFMKKYFDRFYFLKS